LYLRGRPTADPSANLLLDHLLGAELHFLPEDASREELISAATGMIRDLRQAGRRPHFVDLLSFSSQDNLLGSLAYVGMVVELIQQGGGLPSAPSHVYLSSGSEGSATTAGIVVGFRALGLPTRVVGVNASVQSDGVRWDTLDIARRTAHALGVDLSLTIEDVVQERGYVGRGYGYSTSDGLTAMRLAARSEGLVLDPVYTGKALAALVADVEAGRIPAKSDVVFVHTGGTPLVFRPDLARRIAGLDEMPEVDNGGT